MNEYFAHRVPDGLSVPYEHCSSRECPVRPRTRYVRRCGRIRHPARPTHIEAEVFYVVGSGTKKRQVLMGKYGIPTERIFSSHAVSFKQHTMRLTNGQGVDVVLNQSTREALGDSLYCVSTLGTFIELGKGEMQRGSR